MKSWSWHLPPRDSYGYCVVSHLGSLRGTVYNGFSGLLWPSTSRVAFTTLFFLCALVVLSCFQFLLSIDSLSSLGLYLYCSLCFRQYKWTLSAVIRGAGILSHWKLLSAKHFPTGHSSFRNFWLKAQRPVVNCQSLSQNIYYFSSL